MKRLIFLILALLVAGSAMAAQTVKVMTNGTIDLDKLPTLDFSYETDPASPVDGQIWWNETTKQLKVADSAGIYEFNGTLVEWDTTPTAFSFTDVENATTATVYTSDAITVAGISHPAAISVSGDASAKYSINNATAVSTNGTVDAGDEVRAVVTSSASDGAAVNATVTIGGVSDAFGVTTAAAEAPSYLSDDDFEGTGTPSGWTLSSGSSTVFDVSTTGLDLGGSQCFKPSSTQATLTLSEAKDDLCVVFRHRVSAPQTTPSMRLRSGTTILFTVSSETDGIVKVQDQTSYARSNGSSSVVDSTKWIKIWTYKTGGLRYYQTSEYNGTAWVAGTQRSYTTTDTINNLYFEMWGADSIYFDDIRVSETEITGAP